MNTETHMKQTLYKVSSAMKRLDCSRSTIYRMIERGDLELIKIGSTTRITAASIERAIGAKLSDDSEEGVPAALPMVEREMLNKILDKVSALERDMALVTKFIMKLQKAFDERA